MVVAGVDVGGTFTDAIVWDGELPVAVKVPTTPDDQSVGLAAALGVAGAARPSHLAHGTTTATNAVLERTLARTVLVTTEGFRDVLEIGRQARPSLYDLSVVKPQPLVPGDLVVTVAERMLPDGTPLQPLTDAEADRVAKAVAALQPEAVAVCLLFSWAGDGHERALANRLAALGVPLTLSCDLLPELREYERASTCAANAAVAPLMSSYLRAVQARVGAAPVTVMTSGGGTAGLTRAAEAPVHTLLSGPAAGVVAAAAVATQAGFPDALAFDMGGTSTDVCLIRDGRPAQADETVVGGVPVRTPAVGIHSVGAGGGSIAWIDTGGALRAGPRSAGARPGPACYGHGGTQPTVTDAHCALGHLDTDRVLGGSIRLDPDAAAASLAALPEATPHDVLTVVRAAMARALRTVSTQRGIDPAGLALVAYGGAGPLHASALARDLGCRVVIVPPAPGVLSALGLLLAPRRHEAARTVMAATHDDLNPAWRELEAQAATELRRQGAMTVRTRRAADLRYAGQSWELRVDVEDTTDLTQALAEAHRTAYGYALPDEAVEVVTLRVVAEADAALDRLPRSWDLGDREDRRPHHETGARTPRPAAPTWATAPPTSRCTGARTSSPARTSAGRRSSSSPTPPRSSCPATTPRSTLTATS